ncbi:50S ribosomal protein L1 [Candidatus Xianfuyuplasma coldseepsis]|uniref:Large ribosomal subunit protein uL1 n=1 Tax=Candidatus Xianfuyuplasma coldseepsis TaxID=2782163 RepID=A0A7L7KRX5_9MOLU|nr:50S ribosomal protein L1 [Xianfuyuplasma coldseepsis]QMS85355.1 50S ribosomal protein L1 [Xianfuyuplasma coldseepsis]
MAKKGKKFLAAAAQIEAKKYDLVEAVELLKKVSFEKFDASVEFAIRLNLDPRKAEQNLRGAVVLPHGTGKTKTVLVFAQGDKAKEAEAAGADFVGDDEYVEKIQKGWLGFDTVVATPDMMSKIGRLGRVLGPRGLMPNPKTGTVTMDVEKAVTEIKAGKVNYRVDKVGNIHVTVGKVSFETKKLQENIRVIYDTLVKLRPSTVKGVFVQNVSIASTMGPGIKVDSETIM